VWAVSIESKTLEFFFEKRRFRSLTFELLLAITLNLILRSHVVASPPPRRFRPLPIHPPLPTAHLRKALDAFCLAHFRSPSSLLWFGRAKVPKLTFLRFILAGHPKTPRRGFLAPARSPSLTTHPPLMTSTNS